MREEKGEGGEEIGLGEERERSPWLSSTMLIYGHRLNTPIVFTWDDVGIGMGRRT